jgi:hypothetical protein
VEELQIIITYDSNGKSLEGGRRYRLHLPAGIPVPEFWSIIVYDPLSRLMIHTDQPWPSVHSNNKDLVYNADGSVDAWFGPEYIPGQEANCIKTITGRTWYMILRLYNPLEAWYKKKWKPREIEELK